MIHLFALGLFFYIKCVLVCIIRISTEQDSTVYSMCFCWVRPWYNNRKKSSTMYRTIIMTVQKRFHCQAADTYDFKQAMIYFWCKTYQLRTFLLSADLHQISRVDDGVELAHNSLYNNSCLSYTMKKLKKLLIFFPKNVCNHFIVKKCNMYLVQMNLHTLYMFTTTFCTNWRSRSKFVPLLTRWTCLLYSMHREQCMQRGINQLLIAETKKKKKDNET